MELRTNILLIIFITVAIKTVTITSISRTVSTSLGNIRGRLATFNQQDVYQFLGVPYSEPPIGDRRFKKPVSKSPWQDEYDATRYGPSCPQNFPPNPFAKLPNQETDEDCLLLNIYVPGTTDSTEPKAVMVFIHGGGFNSGQGMSRDGSMLAITGNVIVITMNYRLDLLGFLYTGDENFPGNYGLWDQRLALEWIQQHIASFDGDPNKVTVFGVSAGAFSIGLHLISTHSNGLFQRAILESGSSVSPLALGFDPIGIAKNVSITLGCTSESDSSFDTNRFKECLKSKNATEILEASGIARTQNRIAYRLDLAPVIDGDFITESPQTILARGEGDLPFYNCDIMMGTNSAEGGNLIYIVNGFYDARVSITRKVLCEEVIKYLVKDFYRNNATISQKICQEYTNDNISRDEQSMQAVDLVGDMMFVAPTVRTLQYHSENAQNKATYQYLFSHSPNMNTLRIYFPWFRGANHLDEVPFVFDPKLSYSASTNISPDEAALSRKMMKYWTNFAKYGNPNNNDDTETVWPEYTLSEKAYLNINIDAKVEQDLRPEKMKFWNGRLPSLMPTSTSPVSKGKFIRMNELLMTILCFWSLFLAYF